MPNLGQCVRAVFPYFSRNTAIFETFEFTEIIALKLVLNNRKKFDLIQILIKNLITITERIALVSTPALERTCSVE